MNRLILFIFIFVAACKSEFPSIPSDVIPMKEMAELMADIHITDAVAAEKAQGGMDEKQLVSAYDEAIYKNRNVTGEQFIRSYKFYEEHPALYDKLYEEVLVELSKRESRINH